MRETIAIDQTHIINIKGITNDVISSIGVSKLQLSLGKNIICHDFHVVPDTFNINADGILGKDFLTMYNCSINYSNMSFTINTDQTTSVLTITAGPDENSVIIPARSEVVRKFRIDSNVDCVVDNREISPGVFLARTIVDPKYAFIRVVNTTEYPQTIENKITNSEPISNFNVYSADKVNNNDERTMKLMDIVESKIPHQYKSKLNSLISNYADVFALPTDKMSVNNFYRQELRVTDTNPVYLKNYRTPYVQKEEIKKKVSNLLANDLIEPCESNYNSPIILVPKKSTDGTPQWRMCIDYRGVNKKLIADKFPLPRIDDVLDGLGRAVVFSVLDLYNGFHQVPLEENSRDITAFSNEQGIFRWKVLPFGLNICPNSFQRMMRLAFTGLSPEELLLYMDDIIIPGKSEQDHLNKLERTFEICRTRNLKINPAKCQFFRPEVLFLGHICSADGIKPDPSKFRTIENYPKPVDSDAVRRFVAMANYYRKFIANFSIISIPLNALTKKNAPFIWTSECDEAFERMKKCLSDPKTLAYPDYKKEFVLTVDASKMGCGAVLSQDNKPIAFASKSFSRAERNKSTIEQELIAVHWSIKHFKHYLYGTHFIVQSDHKPLIYLYNLKDPSSKLTRLRLELAEFNFSIEHIPGKSNVVADALSRINIQEIINSQPNEKTVQPITTRSMTKKKMPASLDYYNRISIEKEPNIYEAISATEAQGIPLISGEIRDTMQGPILTFSVSAHSHSKTNFKFDVDIVNDKSQVLDTVLSRLRIYADDTNTRKFKIFMDDMLFNYCSINEFKNLGHLIENKMKIVLINKPRDISDHKARHALIEYFHNDPIHGGHTGKKRMNSKMSLSYNWKGMSHDIAKFVDSCHKCKLNKPKAKNIEPMKITATPERAFQKIIIDTIGPLGRSENGNAYILTIMCDLTKFLITKSIPTKEAKVTAKAIFEELILKHGPVQEILTDCGSEYVNQVLKELLNMYNILHKQSTPYHHETVGTVERNHRVFNEYLRAYMSNVVNWEDYVKYFTYCFNTTPHSSFDFKYSPFQLVYGRSPQIFPCLKEDKIDPIYNFDNFAMETRYQIQNAQKMAKDLLEKSKHTNKASYDKRCKPLTISVNDKIVKINEGRHKHEAMYKGPFVVTDISEQNVTILDEKTGKKQIVHKNNVRHY